MKQLFEINPAQWQQEIKELTQYFTIFGTHLPSELQQELNELKHRLPIPASS